MICPKCKSEISDTALRCPVCSTKLKMVCPQCRSLVKFGLKKCNVCGFELLKTCKNCGSINLAGENICRKCKKPVNILIAAPQAQKKQKVLPPKSVVQEKNLNVKSDENSLTTKDLQKDVDTVQNNEIREEKKEKDSEIVNNAEIKFNPAEIFEINVSGVQREDEKTISPLVNVAAGEKNPSDRKTLRTKYYEQPEAKDRLFAALKDDKKSIVALCGDDGVGKTAIIKQVIPQLNKDNINVIYCECSPNTQLAPFGAMQAALRRYLALPDFYANSSIFDKNFKPVIESAFPFLSKSELEKVENFLYNSETSYYENILKNQKETFELLNKILNQISSLFSTVLIIDSFELIDAGSYKYLMSLIKNNMVNNKVKLLLAYKEKIHVQSYLNFINEDENVYENIFVKNLNEQNADNLVKFFLNGANPLPDNIKNQIVKKSSLNAGYLEQAIFYLNDLNSFVMENGVLKMNTSAYDAILPDNYEKLVSVRVETLKVHSKELYDFAMYSALLGATFNVQIIQSVMNLEDDEVNKIINILMNAGYIIPYQNTDFTFRNINFWKIVYEIAKGDDNFVEYSKKLHIILSELESFNLPLKALLAQNINENFIAFNLWTQNIKLASAVGDIDLYVLSQKQCLKLLKTFTHTQDDYIRNNINERVGKLVYKSNPIEATGFLTEAMAAYHKNGNIIKAIELSGFLLKSQKLEDNALTAIEIVDNVLKIMPQSDYELERALIKAKKIDALLKIGNYDELINIVKNEIIPTLEVNLAKNIQNKRYSHEILFNNWIKCAKLEAYAYAYQGNDKALDVIATIEEVINANNHIELQEQKDEIEIVKAIAYTIKGQIDFSDAILENINLETAVLAKKSISVINLIKIINKLMRFDYVNIRDELFEAASFADNCGDVVLKNIFKTLLAKQIKEDGNAQRALEIFSEQVTYFAQEKIATGAFLCWYYMTELYLLTDGADKALEIAMKSLEITKNPKISNYNFMIMFKKIIAEIYLIKRDFDAAKMYIEKALLLARKYGLDYHVMVMYALYGKYLEELVTSKTLADSQTVQNCYKMYDKSNDIAKELNIVKYRIANDDAKKSLQVFCQLNGINID